MEETLDNIIYHHLFSGEPIECFQYRTINDASRAASYNNPQYKCDRRDDNISTGWYRMMGKTGNHVPEYCVPINHCGTHAPGWLNGTHPSVHEGIVTRQVCYHWKGKCCYWKNNIKIRNCGNYYVYHLVKPPTCLLRYCGDWRREWKGELLVCRYELSAGQETILGTLRSNDADDNENVKKKQLV